MKEIVDAFFKTESIVNHQIESYNYFVATKENTNNIMQQIVDETKVSDDEEPGVMVLDKTKSGGREIKIYFSRRKETGRAPAEASIWVDRPEIKEASGASNQITPNEARLRDLHYLAPVNLKLRTEAGS